MAGSDPPAAVATGALNPAHVPPDIGAELNSSPPFAARRRAPVRRCLSLGVPRRSEIIFEVKYERFYIAGNTTMSSMKK
jgi:hypothetical protein